MANSRRVPMPEDRNIGREDCGFLGTSNRKWTHGRSRLSCLCAECKKKRNRLIASSKRRNAAAYRRKDTGLQRRQRNEAPWVLYAFVCELHSPTLGAFTATKLGRTTRWAGRKAQYKWQGLGPNCDFEFTVPDDVMLVEMSGRAASIVAEAYAMEVVRSAGLQNLPGSRGVKREWFIGDHVDYFTAILRKCAELADAHVVEAMEALND